MAVSGTRALLMWCRQETEHYSDVNVYNMTSSWRDGLAFCAIIHRYRPDLIEFDRLSKENIVENNELAFSIAERYLEIPSLLDAMHMVENTEPDKLSIITYVSQLYHCFKDKTPANQGFSTKMKPLPTRARSDSTSGNKIGKRTSPSALSGKAKRMATALRNVFRSDAKEENAPKSRDHNGGVKQNRKVDDGTGGLIKTMPAAGSTCTACHAKVYLMERLVAEKKLFHRSCFKCRKCGTSLRPGTYQYFSDAEIFCCLFDCTTVSEQKPEKPLVIKLRPICDVAAELADENDGRSPETQTPSKSATGNNSKAGSPPKQFAVVKRNTIKLNSLPQSVEKFRSRGSIRRGSHPSKSSSVKAGERKRSLSVGSKYKSKKGHDSRRKFSAGSAKSASPRGSYYGREERSSKRELGAGKDSPGRHKNDIDSAVLGTALKMALMEGAKKSARSKGSDTGAVESDESRGKSRMSEGQRSHVKGFSNVTELKSPEAPTVAKPSAENVRRVVVKELRMETLNEELTPRNSRCFSREFSSDDLSLVSVDGAIDSFKDELLKRAVPKGKNDKQYSESTAGFVKPLGDNQDRSQELGTGKNRIEEKNDAGPDKDCRSSSMESEKNTNGTKNEADVDQDGNEAKVDLETENSQNSQGKEKAIAESTNSCGVKEKNVQNLRNKFMKIDEMIDARHKSNLARFGLQKRKELQSVTSWTQQTSSMPNPRKKIINTSEASKRELGGRRRSIKQLTAMYMNEIEKDKKKGKNRKKSLDCQRERTPSDASSTVTERSESAAGSEPWSRRTSVSSKGGSAQEEEKSTEESEKELKGPESGDDVGEEAAKTASEGDSAEERGFSKDGELSKEASGKEQTNRKRADVSVEVTESCVSSKNGTSVEENKSPCNPNGVTVVIGAEFDEERISAKRDKDSEDGGKKEVVEEKTETKSQKTSHQLPAGCVVEKDLNSIEQTPAPDSDVVTFSVSPPRPEPSAQRIETAPVLGKELTLEIVFPNGAAPSLKRNAASHDSGIDMPSCSSSAQTPSSLEASNVGEELSVVLPIQIRRAPSALDREATLSGNEDSVSVLAEPCSSLSLASGTDVLSCGSFSLTQGSSASVEDSSASSTPRMSIIIAQERSSTKINSRYFSLETSDPKLVSEYRITEECCPDEVMDVEGEFRFGQERIHVTRAEKGGSVSIYKDTTSYNGRKNYSKEDEISLHPGKIAAEIQALGNVRSDLEKKGVEIERALRESIDLDNVPESDEDLLIEWLKLVQRRNMMLRQEAELTYLVQSQTYEQRYRAVENELRHLVAMRDDVKSSDDVKRERELLSELLELVHKRNFIVDHLEEDRTRERNEKLQAAMSDGIADTWDQSPEYTKVAFSRFYC